jgi:two-component system invasion response regulator UvrY
LCEEPHLYHILHNPSYKIMDDVCPTVLRRILFSIKDHLILSLCFVVMNIRILIADDHTIVRDGLKMILSEHPDLKIISEAASGNEVLHYVMDHDVDVIILDISMPGQNGLDTLKQIKVLKPHIPVLILSMYPEEQYAARVIRAGASGYLTKESATQELVLAIRKVLHGGRYITATLAEILAEEYAHNSQDFIHSSLSDREFQILCLIGSGKSVSTISEELHLSVKTVSTYRMRIIEKTGLKNNAEITHYVIKNNLTH